MQQSRPARAATAQRVRERISFRGHPMVLSLHPTTIEVTTEEHLTAKGDCIIGVGASKGCLQLNDEVKDGLRRSGAPVSFKLTVADQAFEFHAVGDPGLSLTNPSDIVVRRSRFLSDRTVALGANAAAIDIPRPMVLLLKNPETVGELEISVG